jgi:hypothetical protein
MESRSPGNLTSVPEMTPLEKLLAVADEETLIAVRRIIGKEQLALMIVKAILADTSFEVSATEASKVLKMPLSTAKDKIKKIAFRK